MRFTRVGNITRLAHVEQAPPWKVIREFATGSGAALLHLQNVSGGILAGDHLTGSIELGEDCEAQITTTGSTRIYRSRDDRAAARQRLCFRVGTGALLEHTPDSIIPFGGSRFSQQTSFELSADSGLFAWEIIAPGRSGERFAFCDLQVQTEISAAGDPLAFDCWRMRPQLRSPAQTLQMDRFTYQATFYVCRVGIPNKEWLAWERAMAEDAQRRPSRYELWGVSALARDGLVFRGLATEALYLIETLVQFWRTMKQGLYGREPVLPRKMY